MLDTWRNRIIVGDAPHLLRALPKAFGSVPLILFSPPYNLGTTAKPGSGFDGYGRNPHQKPGKWGGRSKMGHYSPDAGMAARGGHGKWQSVATGIADGYDGTDDAMPMDVYMAWCADLLDAAWNALSDDGAIFFNHKPRVLNGELLAAIDYVPAELRPYVRQEIVWARAGGVNFSPAFYVPTSERIIIIARPAWRLKSQGASGAGDVWYMPQKSGTWHPAPFPLALAERVLETTGAPLVCDPFMGSGTTGKAARRLGVDWIGFERSAAYAARAEVEIAAVEPIPIVMRELFHQTSLV